LLYLCGLGRVRRDGVGSILGYRPSSYKEF
jgi:hypothetical protein